MLSWQVILLSVLLHFVACSSFRIRTSAVKHRKGFHSQFQSLEAKKNKKARSLEAELAEVTPESSTQIGGGDTATGDGISGTEESETKLTSEQTARIKTEISSPFRGLRKFAYIAIGAAGGLGTFTAVPQLLFAFQDGENVGTAVTNIAIDIGGIVGAVVLWDRESNAEKAKVERFESKEKKTEAVLTRDVLNEREQEISMLPVEIIFSESNENVTRIFKFSDLQEKGQQSVVIVAGNKAYVRDCVLSARLEGNAFFNDNNICVVPVVMGEGEEQLDEAESAKKGFGAKDDLLGAPYIGKAAQIEVWKRYLQKEFETAEEQGADDPYNQGLAVVVNRKGKVVRRGLGLPLWNKLLDDLKPKK